MICLLWSCMVLVVRHTIHKLFQDLMSILLSSSKAMSYSCQFSFSYYFQQKTDYFIVFSMETYPWSLLSHGLFYRLSHTHNIAMYLLFCLILELNRVACSKTLTFFLPSRKDLSVCCCIILVIFLCFSSIISLFTSFAVVKQTNEKNKNRRIIRKQRTFYNFLVVKQNT